MEKLVVSIIICAYTEERLADIKEAVASVIHQTHPPGEVILSVDHNPRLAEILGRELPSSVKIVHNDGIKGLSETRNVGIRASFGDIVAFIDDDAVAEKDWLENLIAPFNDEKVAAVGGKTVPLWINSNRPSWFPEELDWIVGCTYKGLPVKDGQIRNVPGCNMAFRKVIFDMVGGFKAEVGRTSKISGVGEEAEICLRIRKKMASSKILNQSEARIKHKVPSWRLTLGYVWHRARDEGFYKTKVQRLSGRPDTSALSTEGSYLQFLLFTSMPQRLLRFYREGNLSQAGTILSCIVATGLGYLGGKMKRW
jgi:glycosyltransferase involved in cell wall biosynthesis